MSNGENNQDSEIERLRSMAAKLRAEASLLEVRGIINFPNHSSEA